MTEVKMNRVQSYHQDEVVRIAPGLTSGTRGKFFVSKGDTAYHETRVRYLDWSRGWYIDAINGWFDSIEQALRTLERYSPDAKYVILDR
jgi:hypothetical protein